MKTIYRIINRVKSGKSVERQPGSGHHQLLSRRKKDKIIEKAVNEVGVSYRLIGRQTGVHNMTVKKVLIEAGVERKKRKKCPKSDENQKKRQRIRLNKLRKTFLKPTNGLEVIMDDESYFTTDGSDTTLNDFYYTNPVLPVPENVKFKPKAKFPKKALVWVALSSKGFSEPYVVPSGQAITSAVYIRECLPKLKKFINEYHSDNKCVFWPDLASAHYSNATQKELKRLEITYVPKDMNPPNVPQLRPIETYWAIMQRKLYENGWTTDYLPDLIKRIKSIVRKTPDTLSQNLMRGVKTKVRKAADRGPLSVIN